MKQIKKIVAKNFKYFYYFYKNIGYRFIISLSLSLVVGLVDGFGLAMFMPLLQASDSNGKEITKASLGNLSFLVDAFHSINIELTTITILAVMLFFFLLKGVLRFINSYFNVLMHRRIIKKLQFESIDLLANFSYREFVTSDSGKIQNTSSGEVDKIMQAYRAYFNAVQSGILVFAYFIMAMYTDVKFALLVGVGGFLSNLLYKRIYKRTKKVSKGITVDLHKFNGKLIQMVLYFKYLKATGSVRTYGTHLKQDVKEIQNGQQKLGTFDAIVSSTKEPLIVMVVVLVIIAQIKIFNTGISEILLSLLFFYRSLTYLMVVQNYWNNFLAVSGSLDNMSEFIAHLKTHQDKNGHLAFNKLESGIQFSNIEVQLGSKIVLENFSLFLEKNKTIGIVGESGSGKTTFVNVLCGLLKPNKGTVFIDNTSLSDIDIKAYQRRIGYITQEPVIFNDTVFNNVSFWDEKNSNTKKAFDQAIKNAAIDDFISTLPAKEDTVLENNGINVSGGQKQRISIARELYKDLDVLVMDEATSALDSENELLIKENIQSLKGKYTIVIVAHRLSTLQSVDEIILMNNGAIEAKGTFNELLATNSHFRRMAEMQGIAYITDESK
ncbi:MAG: ABC transporter ATP-binding protein [Filimonas sp.]|nr:ABC transporter ATP-binding protein [Filimonas sp.]